MTRARGSVAAQAGRPAAGLCGTVGAPRLKRDGGPGGHTAAPGPRPAAACGSGRAAAAPSCSPAAGRGRRCSPRRTGRASPPPHRGAGGHQLPRPMWIHWVTLGGDSSWSRTPPIHFFEVTPQPPSGSGSSAHPPTHPTSTQNPQSCPKPQKETFWSSLWFGRAGLIKGIQWGRGGRSNDPN